MSYQIEAFLENGNPSLKIWDSKDHSLCLSWTYRGNEINKSQEIKKEVHRLFRQLLLLTLKEDVNNVRVFKAK
jgi:hypothetical protein